MSKARRSVAAAGGRAGENDALGLHPREGSLGLSEGGDLGIDAGLAHAARDQLGHLRPEIDDEDRFGVAVGGRGIARGGAGWVRAHGRGLRSAPPAVQHRRIRIRVFAVLHIFPVYISDGSRIFVNQALQSFEPFSRFSHLHSSLVHCTIVSNENYFK